jgi:hypothetical protein
MKRAATLLLSLIIFGFAQAPGARAGELGRLFLTPAQRSALDARREARLPDTPPAAVVVESPTTRIDGFVTRSSGNSTVWVNGQAVGEGAEHEGLRVLRRRADPSRVTIETGEGERKIDIKVGQSLDRATGEVRDPLRGGEAAPYVPRPRNR